MHCPGATELSAGDNLAPASTWLIASDWLIRQWAPHVHYQGRQEDCRGRGSLRDIQELAGHSSLATTQRYIQGDSRVKQNVVRII
jgi:integrase